MDSGAYQVAIYHPYADMKKSSDALFVLIGPRKNQPMFRKSCVKQTSPTNDFFVEFGTQGMACANHCKLN
jgi:hypothetical protein